VLAFAPPLCLHSRDANPAPHTIAGDGLTFTHSPCTYLTVLPTSPLPYPLHVLLLPAAHAAGPKISRALGEIIYGDTSTSLYINLSVYIVLYKYIIKVNKYPVLYVLYKFIDIYSLIQA
jgi:hypothetical protein